MQFNEMSSEFGLDCFCCVRITFITHVIASRALERNYSRVTRVKDPRWWTPTSADQLVRTKCDSHIRLLTAPF